MCIFSKRRNTIKYTYSDLDVNWVLPRNENHTGLSFGLIAQTMR